MKKPPSRELPAPQPHATTVSGRRQGHKLGTVPALPTLSAADRRGNYVSAIPHLRRPFAVPKSALSQTPSSTQAEVMRSRLCASSQISQYRALSYGPAL
jgi:hypothetical protein